MQRVAVLVGALVVAGSATELTVHAAEASVLGELQQWHKVPLTIDGPEAAEGGKTNPFLDYRMQVTFTDPRSD